MKFNKLRRGICSTLAAVMLLGSGALAAALGEEIDGYKTPVRGETDYSHGVYWTGSDYRRENYMEYTPNDKLFPVVVYGSKLLNTGNFVSMAKLLNDEGYYVVGGINGDYYNMWDNQPLGLVIKDGELITTDGGFVAVGFKEDGTAMIGKPAVLAKASFSGETYQLNSINKARLTGYTLYTSDYAAKTKNSEPGWDIVLSMNEEDTLTADCSLELTVDEIIESEAACEIPDGKLLLSLPKSSDEWRLKGAENLKVGDTVKLSVTCAEGWEDVEWGVGTLYRLLEDGEMVSDLPTGAGPRTAVGIKKDGSVVFYTIDGRKSGHSVGASMAQVAERLKELGCVDAILMDGGGSTNMNMVYPGESALSQIAVPSDGNERSVTNYIMLVSTEPPSGDADRLVLTPFSSQMLKNAKLNLTVKATDSIGFAAKAPKDLDFDAGELGTVEDGVFTANKAGEGKIIVSSDGLTSGEAKVKIVETPDSIAVKNDKNASFTSLAFKVGESLDLTASASYKHLPLVVSDESFKWSVTGDIGTIDELGAFTASETSADGTIEVTAGERTVSIPVTVRYPAGVYTDVKEDAWYYSAVRSLGEYGYMTGVTETEFAPDVSMTRAMLVTLLHRMEGSPAAGAAAEFEDLESGKWYTDAVSWASEIELVKGYDEKTFGVNDSISREQMATLLMRYAAWKGDDVASETSLDVFTDKDAISAYAADAVKWAVGSGLIKGMTETEFSPAAGATRAQVAVLLDRYLTK